MIGQIIFWLFAIALGIELGAGLYETLVVVPVWSAAIPDSVTAYYQLNVTQPQFALNAGPRFWMFFTPTLGLLSIATLLSARGTNSLHRKWRVAGAGLTLFVVLCTFAWFVPNIIKLLGPDVLTMTREDLASTANAWVNLNWVRVMLGVSAWLLSLRAFSIPSGSLPTNNGEKYL